MYIHLPWINKTQWHVFSLVSYPTLANYLCMCMTVVGDWTNVVHGTLSKASNLSDLVYGPFTSPFSTVISKHNLIFLASGIGITSTFSTIINLTQSRKVHLIWI